MGLCCRLSLVLALPIPAAVMSSGPLAETIIVTFPPCWLLPGTETACRVHGWARCTGHPHQGTRWGHCLPRGVWVLWVGAEPQDTGPPLE